MDAKRYGNVIALRDRARGSLIGLAIGDAMGAPTEGMTPDAIRHRFGRVDSLEPDAAGTDDTEYAVLCARSLLNHGTQLTAAAVAETWLAAVQGQAGGFDGAGFSEMVALANLAAGITPPSSGLFNYERWSDGAAMRVAPIGIFTAGDAQEARRLAAIDASVSHAADGIFCAQAIAAGVAVALVTDDYRDVVEAVTDSLPADSWSARLVQRALGIAEESSSLEDAAARLYDEVSLFHYPWADAAPEAVALALGIFAAAGGDFREAVLASVNIGRDSDTIAAMNGALAGALTGYDALPPEWSDAVRLVHGRCVVDTAGTDLMALSDALVDRGDRPVPAHSDVQINQAGRS